MSKSRLIKEWQEVKFKIAYPAQADEWIVAQMARLDERLDSVEKAIGAIQDAELSKRNSESDA